MGVQRFSQQKGSQRQRSLNSFKEAMEECGEDLDGILNHTRYGKQLHAQLSTGKEEAPTHQLAKTLGKVYHLTPRNTKLQWLAVVQSCGFKRSQLVKEFAWTISSASWRNAQTQGLTTLPYAKPSPHTAPVTPPALSVIPLVCTELHSMEVEALEVSIPTPHLPNSKEGRTPALLPFLQTFLNDLSFPCPHTNKQTMPYSMNMLWKLYQKNTNKPCPLSASCFRRIWKQYFKKKYYKARQRDGLCQLCEIGHKIEKIEENFAENSEISDKEKKQLQSQKNVVLRHKLVNNEIKSQYQSLITDLKVGQGILTIDFKENITLGKGPRELGQSWYTRERRTIFGMVLWKREVNGSLSKWHFNLVSDCLAHDAIFVKMALSDLFASDLWQGFKIRQLAIWCDNAPHFRNKTLLAYLLDLTKEKEFDEVFLCYFEAYHGKSDVDSMFGTITGWINDWIKTRYMNTSQDVLACFQEKNQTHPNSARNFFRFLSLSPNLWTKEVKTISNIKLKEYQYFHFSTKLRDNFQAKRYAFKSNRTTTGVIELSGLITDTKLAKIARIAPKRQPKFSKTVELVNSVGLTESDEEYLQKKARAWGIKYKRS